MTSKSYLSENKDLTGHRQGEFRVPHATVCARRHICRDHEETSLRAIQMSFGEERAWRGMAPCGAFKRPAPAVWGNGLWGSVGWGRAIL
jgi:hypothetical protein